MKIFENVSHILNPNNGYNMNDLDRDKFDDPEKIVKLIIAEIKEAIQKIASSLSNAIIQERKLKNDFQASQTTHNLQQQYEKLKEKLKEAIEKSNTLIARDTSIGTSRRRKKTNEIDFKNTFCQFDEWEEKIMKIEAEEEEKFIHLGEFTNESPNNPLEEEFKKLAGNSLVDDYLLELKAKLKIK